MTETNVKTTMGEDESYVLELRRIIKAPRQRVFDAFVNPEVFRKWWGPEGVQVENLALDVRVGGEYSLEMHHSSGNIHYLSGVYSVIEAPERLAYSWHWGVGEEKGAATLVELAFLDVDGGTEVVLTHSGFDSEEARNNHNSGWGGSFNCLETVIKEGANG